MRPKLYHVLNLLLNDYIVNLLLLLVTVAICCTGMLLSFALFFCGCYILYVLVGYC